MNKRILTIGVAALTLFFTSCGEEKVDKKEDNGAEKKAKKLDEVCLYSYDNTTSKVEWEAYKTNEKIGVKGTFDELTLGTQKQAGESLDDLFRNSAFKVITNTVKTGDAERDGKISDYFFGNLDDGSVLRGTIVSVVGDAKSGVMNIELDINRTKIVQKMPYKVDASNILSGEFMIDLDQFRAQPAIESLNNKCEELHTGIDGVSKLWPDVKVILSTQLKVDCR